MTTLTITDTKWKKWLLILKVASIQKIILQLFICLTKSGQILACVNFMKNLRNIFYCKKILISNQSQSTIFLLFIIKRKVGSRSENKTGTFIYL